MRRGRRWATIVLLAAVVGYAVVQRDAWVARVPPGWNPWAPLTLSESPGPFTRTKVARLRTDPAACRALLDEATALGDLEHAPVPDRRTGPGCGFENAVRIAATSLAIGEPFTLSCPAAASLVLWERHVVQPAAVARFGVPAAGLEHWGSYACRNVYHRASGTRSRHATADALDVAGFVLADGRRIRVRSDWQPARGDLGSGGPGGASASGGADEGRVPGAALPAGDAAAFLREVRDGACRWFDAVLSPEYNAAHGDHLHLDRGPYRACR